MKAGDAEGRDWGSQVNAASVAVSSTGVSGPIRMTNGSAVSSSSCSSYQGRSLTFYQPKDSTSDLKKFSDTIMGHLQVVTGCLSQTDVDLLAAAKQTQGLFMALTGSAQAVSSKLSKTAGSALEQLPTLLWAAKGHGGAQLHTSVAEVHDSMADLRKATQDIRNDYIDLLLG